MLTCKILEGLIRLFGKIRFDESTHPLDGGLFAAFGGLSEKLKGRRGSKRPRLDHRNSSNAGSINTQMMLNRYSTNPTSAPFSNRPSHESYLSGRPSMGHWVDSNGIYSAVPDGKAPQEVLMDSAPTRGFSVVRGGRAVYQDPYAALPTANAAGRVAYPPNARSLTSPDRRTTFAPLPSVAENGTRQDVVPAGSRPIRHARTRSQTAIIESFPPGPEGGMPGALGFVAPPSNRSTTSFSLNRGIAPPVPLVLQSNYSANGPMDRNSIDSSQEENQESVPRKSTKPSTWFGRSKTNVNQTNSDSEEELVDYGGSVEKVRSRTGLSKKTDGKGHGGNSSSGGWLSALLPASASKQNIVESNNENSMSENTARHAATILLEGDDGTRQPISDQPVRSFRVNRQNTPSNPATPHAAGTANLPGPISPTSSEHHPGSQRSFAVNRGNRSAGNSAGSSRVTTPGTEHPPPFTALTPISNDNRGVQDASSIPGRSFVVQRASQSNGNLAPPVPETGPSR